MKYCTVNLTCTTCGKIFQKTTSIKNGIEERIWKEWSRIAFPFCNDCSNNTYCHQSQELPITLNVVSVPYQSKVCFFIKKEVRISNELKVLGYSWRPNLMLAALNNLVAKDVPYCWGKAIEINSHLNIEEVIIKELALTKSIVMRYKNHITVEDLDTWHRLNNFKNRGVISETVIPDLIEDHYWDHKLYYKAGKIFIRLDSRDKYIKYVEAVKLNTYINEERFYRNRMDYESKNCDSQVLEFSINRANL